MCDISVIIACYNGEATLAETLESLTAQVWDGSWEILLADNGSTDASAEIFAAHAGRHPDRTMRRIDASAERGKSAALNAGLAAAAGRAFLFVDSDDTVPPDWLAAMARALESHDFVATYCDVSVHNKGWVRTYRDPTNKAPGLRRLTHPPYCWLAGGAEMGFTRRLYLVVGGFDTAFTVQEDHDFCIRAYLKGFELHPVPETRYNYRFRADFSEIYRQAYSYAHYRALLRKRYAPAPLLSPLPWLELTRRIVGLGVAGMLSTIRPNKRAPLERARYNARLGQALGEASGAIAFRVAPPLRRPLPAMVTQRAHPQG